MVFFFNEYFPRLQLCELFLDVEYASWARLGDIFGNFGLDIRFRTHNIFGRNHLYLKVLGTDIKSNELFIPSVYILTLTALKIDNKEMVGYSVFELPPMKIDTEKYPLLSAHLLKFGFELRSSFFHQMILIGLIRPEFIS